MNTLHFILDVTRTEEGIFADLFDSDEPFGPPVASTQAATADEAIANLFASITVTFPDEGPFATLNITHSEQI